MNEENPMRQNDEYLVPVRMINPDVCLQCPDLEVENEQLQMIEGKTLTWTNRLTCKHYCRCKNLVRGLERISNHA